MRVALVAAVVVAATAVAPPAAADGNQPPMAEAGLDQRVTNGTTVVLDAGGSSDPDGDIVAYDWSIETPDGRVAAPAEPAAVRTRFLPDRTGRYVLTLTVTDDSGATTTDVAYVDVAPGAPGNGDGSSPGSDPDSNGDAPSSDDPESDGTAPDRGSDGSSPDGTTGNGTDAPAPEDPPPDGDDPGDRVEDGDGDGRPPATDDPGDGIEGEDGRPPATDPGDRDGDGEPPAPGGTDGPDGPGATTPAGNTPPWVSIDGPSSLAPGKRGQYSVSTGDFDGQVRSVRWASGRAGPSTVRTAPGTGPFAVSATVVDDDGAVTVVTRTVRVGPDGRNRPPTVELSAPGRVRVGGDLDIEATASDPDGTVVDVAFVPARQMDLSDPGTRTIRVRVTDDDGATATDTLRVAPVSGSTPITPAPGLPDGTAAGPRPGPIEA